MENTTQETEEVKSNNEQGAGQQSQAEMNVGQAEAAQKNDLTKIQGELAESKDKYLRLYSEFENFRRRTNKEKYEMIQSANEQLIKSLLPVADDFERAEKALGEKADKDAEGFTLIKNKFRKILEQYGVRAMDLQRGGDFNPDLHEAITQIPAPDDTLKGKVVEVVEKGYLLNEKVIRYAKVVVGN